MVKWLLRTYGRTYRQSYGRTDGQRNSCTVYKPHPISMCNALIFAFCTLVTFTRLCVLNIDKYYIYYTDVISAHFEPVRLFWNVHNNPSCFGNLLINRVKNKGFKSVNIYRAFHKYRKYILQITQPSQYWYTRGTLLWQVLDEGKLNTCQLLCGPEVQTNKLNKNCKNCHNDS